MASSYGNEPPDVTSLLKNLSKSEITLISELLRNKASKQLQDGVSEVSKIVGSLINSKNGMSECDTIYWYCNIKLLSSALQSAEQQALGKLKSIKKSFDCTTCKKKVELNYRKGLPITLQKHVCNPSKPPGMSGSDQNKLSSLQEYELNEILRYGNKIKEKLFFKVPKNNLYLYTIYVIDDVIKCLVCGCEIPGRTNVMQHVSGSRHIKGLQQDYSIVLAFHKYFEKLKAEYQVLQRDFCIYDNTSVQCVLCSHIIPLQDVKQHIEGPCFGIKEDGKYVVPVKYDAHIKATIYKDLLDFCIIVDNVNCPMLQNIGNGIYCLLCNANVTKHIYIHIDSSVHQAHLESKTTLDCLKKYHQVWTALPVHIQVEQTYFRRREGKITCIVCSTYFRYNVDDLASHVNSMNHKMFLMKMKNTDDPSPSFQKQSSQSVSSRSASVETDRTNSLSTSSSSSNIENKLGANSASIPDVVTPPIESSPVYTNVPASLGIAKIPYDQSVLEELYPDGLMLFTITMDTVKYPIIIKRETAKHCFICNADVSTSLLLHANSPEHIQQMGSDRRRELLKKFHDLWISLPQSDQCRQIAFKIENDLVCMLCDKKMAYDIGELKSHIESWEHVQKVMAKHVNGIPNDIKQVSNFSQTLSNGIVPNSPARSISNTMVDNRVDVPIEKPKSLQGAVTYSKEILNDLYGEELIHYYIRIDDTRYPFIQNMGTYKRCLICNIDLISSVLFHINSSPHIQSVSDPEKIKQLRRYHDLWLNFSESDQREQKHFEIGEKLKCSLCQKELEYDVEALTAHIFSTGHGNETWSLKNQSSTVSGKLIDESNLSEIENSSDEEVLEAEPVEGQTLDGNNSETSVLEVDSNSVGQQMNERETDKFIVLAYKSIIYDKTTMESVYSNLHQYVFVIRDKRLFFIQNRNESKYCLICSLPIINVDEHIKSDQHLRNEQDDVILKRVKMYHKLFVLLETKFHKEQIYFVPEADGIRCIPCGLCFSKLDALREHLKSHDHVQQVEERRSKKDKCEASLTSEEKTDVPSITLESLKSNLESYTVVIAKKKYYYIQNRGNYLYCLICRRVLSDLSLHLRTLQHANNLHNKTTLGSLKKFYEFFEGVPLYLKVEQIYFAPNKDGVKCLKCDLLCSQIRLLQLHLISPMHGGIQNPMMPEPNVVQAEASENVSTCNETDLACLMKLDSLKSDLQPYTVVIKGNKYYYIQNRGNYMCCLICRRVLDSVSLHVRTLQHAKNLRNKAVLESLKNFYELFESLPLHLKVEQVYFVPNVDGVKCLKCDFLCSTIPLLQQHLISKMHEEIQNQMIPEPNAVQAEVSKSVVKSNEKCPTTRYNLLEYIIIIQGLGYFCIQNRHDSLYCLICRVAIKNPSEHVKSAEHLNNEQNDRILNSVKRYHELFLSLNRKSRRQQIYFTPQANGVNCLKCNVLSATILDIVEHLESLSHIGLFNIKPNADDLHKDNVIKREEYSTACTDLYEYFIIIQRLRYFFIQIRPDSFYCLICRVAIKNPTEHVKCAEHLSSEQDDGILNSVKRYYELFLSLNRESRRQKIYFTPQANGVNCLECDIFCATTQDIIEHLESLSHIGLFNKKPNADVLHKDNVIEREEYPTACTDLYEYFIMMAGLRYFFIQIRPDSFYCLMCRTPINKIVEHIKDVKHLNNQRNGYVLNSVKRYHDSFLPLKPKLKRQKIYFEPSTNGVNCLRCEAFCATSAEIQEHLEHSHIELSDVKPKTDFLLKKMVLMELEESLPSLYSNETLDEIYPNLTQYSIDVDNVMYPCIQKRPRSLFCLACQTAIYSPIETHIINESHIKRCQDPVIRQMISNYHRVFTELPPKQQVQQTDFELYVNKMTCIPCTVSLPLTAKFIKHHLESQFHYNNVMNIALSSDEETPEEPPTTTAFEGGDISNHIEPCSTSEIYDNIYILEHFNKTYCLLCEKHITPDHLRTKKHIKKLNRTTNANSVIHKRVETFLRKWDEVAVEYQHMKNEFLPASPTLTFCLKCAVNVEFSMMEKHLSQFHGEVLYDLPEKLSLNFKSPTTRYPQKIVDKYFKENIPQCNIITDLVAYPIFQNTIAGLCCLVCRVTVHVDVFTHLSSQSHLNHLLNTTKKSKQKMIRYHDFWAGLPSKYQEQIYYFNNAATSSFFCLICSVGCGKKKMVSHFESSEHISHLFQQESVKAFAFSNNKSSFVEDVPKEPIEKKRDLFKGSDVQEHLFPRKINDFVRKLHCLDVDIIQSPTNDKFFCFLCQTETNDVVKHTALPQHELKLLDHSTNVEPVRVFHDEWRKIDQENRHFQASFFPVTSSIVFCKICCLNVEYKQLDNHLNKCHDEVEYAEFQDRLDVDFNFISKKEYSPKVQRTLYKDNIPQCNLILEGISYPVIQTVDNHLRCLLCQKEISDDKYSHLNSINHALSAINLGMKKRLKMYHDTWLDGDEHFQMQQIYFEKDRDYYCKVCVLDVKMGDLREHITSTLHTISLQKFLINERSLDKSNVFHDIEILPQLDKSKMNESLNVSQLDGYYNSDSESEEGSDDGPKQYSKSVISECYPDFDKYNCTVDGIPYPIFRNTLIGTVCMLCKRNPQVESVNEHIGKDSHKSRMMDETRHNKLRNFHKAWMKQEPAVQNHQKYFHRMQCLPCATQVDYDSIADHVLNSKHERKIKLPFNTTAKERHDGEDYLGAASSTSTPIKSKKINNEAVAPHRGATYKIEKANQSPKSENNRKSRHNIKKSIQNPNSQNIVDRIPLRYGKDAKFLIVEKTNIFCGICSKKLKNDIRGVKEHLDSAAHLTKSNISRKKIKYSCDICNKYYSTEGSWDNHLVDLTHMARYNNLAKSKKGLTEYECLTCSLVIFGDETAVQKHHALFANKRTKEIVLPKPVLYLISSRSFIQDNCEKLLKEAKKAFESQDKEKQVCVALVKVLKEYYPQCKAYPFGSRLTGLGYCDSDLDVFLDTGDMYNGNHRQDAEEQANIVNIVARTLQKHKNSFSDINKVAGARTPIVQVFHKDSNIDCDISFKHGLSVENTTFIKLCLDLQTVLTPTLLYLKEWYASTNLSGLSSYALTMLMIFYLQTTGYLLSVKDLRLINSEKGQIIDGWETIKYTVSLRKMKEYVNNCDYTVIQLLENFFEYYAKFDFEKWVVCPLMGYLMSKSNFNGNGVNLPAEMANYVQKLRASPNPEYFRNLTPMCVQDPFDLSHNLTKAFPRDMLKKFQAYCSLSKKHISALN
ncbi:poly a polymerase cid pap -related [Holotrichia oblita]|uniref:Poly a polymerase cid pap -related n=1 Tax=Holotrichia oblita TaxID=644536 RepID=A0ACB9SVQ3_HOLOL|nr:poly a polymerase cid pap -related [Holotrichia oblita]